MGNPERHIVEYTRTDTTREMGDLARSQPIRSFEGSIMTKKERTQPTREARAEKAFKAKLAKLSDDQLLKALEDVKREVGLLRTGRELYARQNFRNPQISVTQPSANLEKRHGFDRIGQGEGS